MKHLDTIQFYLCAFAMLFIVFAVQQDAFEIGEGIFLYSVAAIGFIWSGIKLVLAD